LQNGKKKKEASSDPPKNIIKKSKPHHDASTTSNAKTKQLQVWNRLSLCSRSTPGFPFPA